MKKSTLGLVLVSILAVALIAGIAVMSLWSSKTVNLEGDWEATLTSGAKLHSPMVHLDGQRYRLVKLGVFSGVYELRGDQLVIVEPVDKRLAEFVWRVQGTNDLVLIQSSTKTGQDYTGAMLKRINP